MYSYFLILKSYINTYISIIYTESTVRNVKPQGNHNNKMYGGWNANTVRNVKPQGNHNFKIGVLVEILSVSNIKPKGNSKGSKSTPLDII